LNLNTSLLCLSAELLNNGKSDDFRFCKAWVFNVTLCVKTHHLMVQELYWASDTSRTNVQPRTAEIEPKNLDKGMVLWFKWDTNNRTLVHLKGTDRDSDSKFPFSGGCDRRCTTTLLYCQNDGFASIPYNPFRDPQGWAHWWDLGFKRDRNIFTIERDDAGGHLKRIAGNRSGWFNLFRGTQHDSSPGVVSNDTPLLTGEASLIWALAAFRFDAGTLAERLPTALGEDGQIHMVSDCPSGSMESHVHADVYRLTLLRVSRDVSTRSSRGDMGTKGWANNGSCSLPLLRNVLARGSPYWLAIPAAKRTL